MDTQLKFLKKLCQMFDGENYVMESDIRKHWKRCPSHNTILSMENGTFFDYNLDPKEPGYMPTAEGLALIRTRRREALSIWIGLATLVVSALTLAATLI